jgi:hypothetical protein
MRAEALGERADPQQRIADRRADGWRWMDAQIAPGGYLLSDKLCVLDLYVATVSHRSPRPARFYREASKMAEIVRRIDADPRLAELWNSGFFLFMKVEKDENCTSVVVRMGAELNGCSARMGPPGMSAPCRGINRTCFARSEVYRFWRI